MILVQNQAFDPDAPEGAVNRGSQYVTKKDIKVVGIALVVLAVLMVPVFLRIRAQGWNSQCRSHLGQVAKAMTQYAELNNNRFPPAYITTDNGMSPLLQKGKPVTWATLVFPFMERGDLVCPASKPEERIACAHPDSTELSLMTTYGMFAGLSAAPVDRISNPGGTVAIGETTPAGKLGTFNPEPMLNASGEPIGADSFLIGFDTANSLEEMERLARADGTYPTRATRLAFFDVVEGGWSPKTKGRHGHHNNFLMADGSLSRRDFEAARVPFVYPSPKEPWAVPR